MFQKLKGVENRFIEVEKLLSDPEILNDRIAYEKYSREHADLNKIVSVFRKYQKTAKELDDSRELLKDEDPDIILGIALVIELIQKLKSAKG